MEDVERFIQLLQESASQLKRLEKLLQEDREDGKLGLSGEAELLYRSYCDRASDKLKEMRKNIAVLISESSAGLI